ncbi:pantetheine-phosphate adenylyltransferase [Falsarthrobacter nasiphocae]|uniref:Phosphopantetheine adenylyltransferase n=1 Tax=Falsarthrobacter nasiphocae TaxID=189863 RepID=A0AAE3YHK3_9MICC|nr:pantetheine-phosphate adenylyltransferase [Falsarthrobacter nasiphocae]MDR6892847.1 pantetheine-phosphate adenylyltransferase [Falsarthrobacter nasiphocae]
MRRAVCPGSFDPLHSGHVEVITRAASLFDDVVVAVAANLSKKHLFTLEERLEMAEEVFRGLDGVSVMAMPPGTLLADFCHDAGAAAIVKGLRNGSDLDYEVPMAVTNRHLSGVETVFLPADPRHAHVSSTIVREVHLLGGDVSAMVPGVVGRRLTQRR